MIAALIVIPAGALLALLFAAWLAWDVLGRSSVEGEPREAAEAVRQAVSSVTMVQGVAVLAVGLFLALVAGAVAGALHGSLDRGVVSGLAAMAGVVTAALSTLVAVVVAAAAVGRVAASPATGAHLAGRAAAAGAFMAVGLAIASLGGLVAFATRLLDFAPADAPLPLAAFAAGALVTALVAHLGSAPPADAAWLSAAPDEDARSRAGAFAASAPAGSPAVFGGLSAALAGAMVLASPITRATADAEWLLFPPVLAGVGVVAAIVGVLAWPGWERLARSPRDGFAGAGWAAVVIAAVGLAAASALTLGGEWHWPFFAGLTGILGASVLLVAGRLAGARPVAGPLVEAGLPAGVLAAVVVVAFAVGREAGIPDVEPVAAGLFGVAVASMALMMPVAVMQAIAGSTGPVLAARAISPAGHAAASAGEAAAEFVRPYVAAAVTLGGVVLLLAFLAAVREEFGRSAFEAPERYAANVHALGLLPPGPGSASAASARTLDYTDELTAIRRLSDGDRRRLMVASARESVAIADALGLDDESAQRVAGGSPVALPALLPLNLARPEAIGGALAALVILALIAGTTARVLGAAGSSVATLSGAVAGAWRWLWLPLLVATVTPVVAGAGFRSGFGGDGNEGWLAFGSAAGAALVGALFVTLLRPGGLQRSDPLTGTTLGAVQLAALLVPAVGLVVVPLLVA